jgi:hypothetical protein
VSFLRPQDSARQPAPNEDCACFYARSLCMTCAYEKNTKADTYSDAGTFACVTVSTPSKSCTVLVLAGWDSINKDLDVPVYTCQGIYSLL